MNENAENKNIEDILRKANLPEPSSKLKERIIHEAKITWTQIPSELPWQVPIRRLIVSAAASVLIIWLTNNSSNYLVYQWQSSELKIANQQRFDLDALTEIPYGPLAGHLVSAGRRLSITDASVLRDYAETVRSILSESQQNGISKTSAPTEDRSILLPKQSGLNSYS